MNQEKNLQTIRGLAEEVLAADDGCFLVEVLIKPVNNVKVFVDTDEGVALDKLVHYNRALYKKIGSAALFPEGDFSLEVSSPGVGEPLKLHRQYRKNIGRKVEVELAEGTKKEGLLREVDEEKISLEVSSGKGKQQTLQQMDIPFSNIKHTKVCIVF